MHEELIWNAAAVFIIGIGAQWLAWRLRLPSILLLLLSGILVGPAVLGWVEPDRLLGDALLPFVSISVGIILFEGGLSLRFHELRASGQAVWRLVSTGALITWVAIAALAYWLLHFDLSVAILLGAILIVTGPTVIGPVLRQVRPTGKAGDVLKWEGILIDPLGAVMAVLVFEMLFLSSAGEATRHILLSLGEFILIGGGLGLLGAGVMILLLRHFWIPDHLHSAVTLMSVVFIFTFANWLQAESGLLAVTVMGLALANQRYVDVRHIVEFKENIRVILIALLFILLGARVSLAEITHVGWREVLFLLALILVVRPLSVFLSTWRTRLSLRERAFVAWMAPRGIVAAAVSSVFALRLEEAGMHEGNALAPLTFLVIISTVLVYGLTVQPVARRLGVASPQPQGFLIASAEAWVRRLALLLQQHGIPVRLVDTNEQHVREARQMGLTAYHANVLSDFVETNIDLGGVGRLLACTPNDEVNILACAKFTHTFGRKEVYRLAPKKRAQSRLDQPREQLHGRLAFGDDVTCDALSVGLGAQSLNVVAVDDRAGDLEALLKRWVPLFTITRQGQIRVVTAEAKPTLQPGNVIVFADLSGEASGADSQAASDMLQSEDCTDPR